MTYSSAADFCGKPGSAFRICAVSPGYFEPLTSSVVGYILVIIASLFWIASLVVARKILAVDI